ALRLALHEVEGTYGIMAFHLNEDKIVAARNGSPIVLGIGKNEFFVASDASSIIEHTKDVVYLDDGEILEVNKKNYSIKNLKNSHIDKKVERLNMKLEQMQKNNFKHFMLKEIFDQPDVIKDTMRGRIQKEGAITKFDGLSDNFTDNVSRIIITACGTSWHASLIGEYLIEDSSRIPVEVEYASEFRYRNPVLGKNDLVIVISQSGETADTLAALKEAKKHGAKTMGIINVVGSTIAREAGRGIYIHAGHEVGVASTKAFTSQITALLLLNLFLGRRNKNISAENGERLIDGLEKIPEQVEKILKNSDKIKEIAKKYYKKNNFLYLGRGINFPVALEGALKLKEISYIHAEGYPAAEMKHGPIALIDDNMPVVFIANKGPGYRKIMSNMEEVKARNGRIIAVATEDDKEITEVADDVIFVPKTLNELTPLLNTIPLQLLAYYIADMRGCDIDKPRNLAKSVTVE
ncbi:glutamine--fructose-6-phosphate transaminase (isomerizing), partial [Candidatus Woesearchaeota archaeon]|nr:glutamine--fructose-6-phosphate transaminase (isomerizing) [Candidatus Woesearchaeota archaeon]